MARAVSSAYFSAYISFTALLKYGTALTESIDVTAFLANNSCRHLIPSVTGADTADPEPQRLQLGSISPRRPLPTVDYRARSGSLLLVFLSGRAS